MEKKATPVTIQINIKQGDLILYTGTVDISPLMVFDHIADIAEMIQDHFDGASGKNLKECDDCMSSASSSTNSGIKRVKFQ